MLFSSAVAEVVSPSDDFWYLDEAGVLSDATEGEIFFANQRLYEACGAEIVVVAIESTGGMTIDDYAYTLFNQWEIGGNSYRGMLLLMAIEDDDYYAMPGTAMNSYFDSATLGDMLTTYLEPSFASKNYDQGVKRFFEAVYEKVVDDLNLNLTITDAVSDYNAFLLESSSKGAASAHLPDTERESRHGGGISFGTILLIVILLVVLIAATRRFGKRSRRAAYAPPPPPPVRPPRRNSMSFPLGFMLGRMTANRPRAPRPGPGVPPPMGGFGIPPKAQSRPNSNRPSSGSFSGGFSQRSGGMGRSSSSRPGGGFGGASRSGGASRGPSTRGGGAGRFSRK